jgi:hypothetical protein
MKNSMPEEQQDVNLQTVDNVRKKTRKAFVRNRIVDSDSESTNSDVEPISHVQFGMDVEPNSDVDSTVPELSAKIGVCRKPTIRMRWQEEEITTLKREFAKFLKSDCLPLWSDIDELKSKYPAFKSRTHAQIKARFVHVKKSGR